jgi:hypothetical protein
MLQPYTADRIIVTGSTAQATRPGYILDGFIVAGPNLLAQVARPRAYPPSTRRAPPPVPSPGASARMPRCTSAGKPWASFPVAVDAKADGEVPATWVRVALFGDAAP